MKFTLLIGIILALPFVLLATREARIVGGSSATTGQFPFMGSIRVILGLAFKCGSSIYNDRYLITAAHCTTGESTTTIGVYLGSLTSNLGGAYYSLADIIYNGYDPTTKANDISLMKTASKITYSTTVQPLPLSLTVIGAGAKATAIGWGRSSFLGELLASLTFVETTTLTETDCRSKVNSTAKPWITSNTLCVLNATGIGLCNGDSGGPLVLNGEMIGVNAFGFGCAGGFPDVTMRITSYINWIQLNAGNFSVSGL